MKTICGLFLCLIFSFSTRAQTELPIIGKISDLEGKKKVYLLAETTDSRTKIQKVLDKEKLFEIVSDPEKAEFIIEFKPISKSQPISIGIGTFKDIAEMNVYFYNSNKKKVIAWSATKDKYKDSGFGYGTKDNEALLTKSFLKTYKGK
jgi:hypothetical protein